MDIPAAAAVFFACFYVPGLFVGLSELEIESDGLGFWASRLDTWRVPVCGARRMTLTGYHLTFFTGLLATSIAAAAAGAVLIETSAADLAARILLAGSVFVMVAVVEDNTWWIYRGQKPSESARAKLGEFSGFERTLRYFVGGIVAAILFGAAGELAAVDRVRQLSIFFLSLAYLAGAVILDALVWSRVRNWARPILVARSTEPGEEPLL